MYNVMQFARLVKQTSFDSAVFDANDHIFFRFRETKIYPDILVQSFRPFVPAIKVNLFQLRVRKPGFTSKLAE